MAMFVDPLFKLMSEKQASDMFFTVGAPIQIKINGVVMPVNPQVLDGPTCKKICYELMSETQIREFEDKLEMNFAVGRAELGSFRVNIFKQRGAVAMVIRFIKPDIPTIEQLKLPAVLKDIVMEKLGMIIIVGSTGSGKSSSMAAMIDYRNATKTGHILTIEDPMEFSYKHKKSIVNQREVGMDTRSYDDALISAMREAPDLLMIGEVRDKETLQSALLFAQTGHLLRPACRRFQSGGRPQGRLSGLLAGDCDDGRSGSAGAPSSPATPQPQGLGVFVCRHLHVFNQEITQHKAKEQGGSKQSNLYHQHPVEITSKVTKRPYLKIMEKIRF